MRTLQKGRLYRLRIDIMRMKHNMYLLNLILVYAMSVCLLALVATPPAGPAKIVAARNTDVASVQVSEAARRLSTTAQNAFLVSSVRLCTYLLS